MAAQFTLTKARAARGQSCLWMARAMSSLPVPVSPGNEHGGISPGATLADQGRGRPAEPARRRRSPRTSML